MDRPDYFLVEAGSDAGRKLAQEMAAYLQAGGRQASRARLGDAGTEQARRRRTSPALYDNPEWQTGVDWCLSCAACTTPLPDLLLLRDLRFRGVVG